MLKKFSKKVVLITGAGKGIGRALSESLLSKGAFVYALTRSKGSMKDIEKNKNIKIFYGDVSNIKLIKKILNTSIKEKKIINAVVNNAGIRQRKKFLKLSSSDINDVFKVNFFSIFRIMQLYCSYSIKDNIRVNIVLPGFIKTSYFEKFKKNKKKLYKWTIDRTPISRWGEANEVVNLVEFLISDDSSYITGSSFNVDGGWLSS